MSCTLSVFPFLTPQISPSLPHSIKSTYAQAAEFSPPPIIPRHDGPLALATYLWNSCGTNSAVTWAQLIKLLKIFELVMPCDWYHPAIKVENYSFPRGSSEVKCTQPKDFNSKSPRGVTLLSEENWQAVRIDVVFCELGFTQRWLQVKCNKLVHKPPDSTPLKFLILQNKRVSGGAFLHLHATTSCFV